MSEPKQSSQWSRTISLGDQVAFREMFECYYAALCIYARRYIEDIQTCEDVVQDVFCMVWVNREKLDYTASLKSYLVVSVRNKCLNYLRSKGSLRYSDRSGIDEHPYYSENMEELLFLRELEGLLADALSKLPTEYRIAFEMSRMENKSVEEIAERLQVSPRTVERYRNKALDLLKKDLKDYLPLLLFMIHTRI